MKELYEEYGAIVVAAVSSVLLIGLTAAFLTNGQVFTSILAFSQSIC